MSDTADISTLLLCGDLHCGKGYRSDCAEGFVQTCHRLNPDAVAVAGDLTFRARVSQFQMAQSLLARLDKPLVIVPGNHDIPLYDVFTRATRPFANWLECYKNLNGRPDLSMGNFDLLGLNTIFPVVHQKGFMLGSQKNMIAQWSGNLLPGKWRGLMMHQQLYNLPGHFRPGKFAMAQNVAAFFEEQNVDVVLYGHVHYPAVLDAREIFPNLKRRMTLIASGTVSNRRTRGPEPNNTFQLLKFAPEVLTIDTYAWDLAQSTFVVSKNTEVPRR